jgi:hypothetical protein
MLFSLVIAPLLPGIGSFSSGLGSIFCFGNFGSSLGTLIGGVFFNPIGSV